MVLPSSVRVAVAPVGTGALSTRVALKVTKLGVAVAPETAAVAVFVALTPGCDGIVQEISAIPAELAVEDGLESVPWVISATVQVINVLGTAFPYRSTAIT